jgi:stage II sporulation protein E
MWGRRLGKGGLAMPDRQAVVEPYLRTGRSEPRTIRTAFRARRLDFPAELVSWETLGAIVALILLTQLRLMGELAPFGLAFWAVSSRGQYRRMILYGAVMVGTAAASGNMPYAVSLAFSAVLYFLLADRFTGLRVPFAAAVGAAFLVGGLPRMWAAHFYTYDVMLLLMESVMAVMAAAFFVQVHRHPLSGLSPERNIEAATSWIIFAGLLLLSLMQAGTGLLYVAAGVSRYLVLAAAFALGPGMAAATGALLGFLMGIQGAGFIWLGMLTFAGFLSGLFRSYGRPATAGGFFLGITALSFYTAGWETIPLEATITACAVFFFLLGPVIPMRVQALAPLFAQAAGDEAKQVRELTAVRIKDYARVFRELSQAFMQAAAPAPAEKELPMKTLVEAVVERVCKHCPSRRRCWDKDAQRTYNTMLRLLADLENGRHVDEIKSPEFFQKICRKKEEFIKTISFIHEMELYQERCHKKLEEGRTLVTMQLAGLSHIMSDLAKEVQTGIPDRQKALKNQYFHVEIGVAQEAKGNADVCGDYYSYLELRDGKQAFILSDGMGNGSRAQQESRSTVHLVEKLLLAGFRKDAVVRTVNTILQLRSSEENFATLDVLLVDTENGEAEFLKVGAAPSFIRQRHRVREVKSPSVPLGILDDVELKPVLVELEDDVLIVMATDGIFEVLPAQPEWFIKYLAGQTLSHPQVLADEIMRHAGALSGQGGFRDDVTVLVCRTKRLKHKIRDFVTR